MAALALAGAWARPPGAAGPGFPDAGRPVVVTGRARGAWTPGPGGWSLRLAVDSVRQGLRVERWRREIRVWLPRRPEPAHRWRFTGFLSRPPGFANFSPPRAGPWRLRVKSLRFAEGRPGPALLRLSGRLRGELDRGLRRQGPASDGLRLVRALVLGESWELPVALRRGLRRCGLSHLVAVSGLHVGLLMAAGLLAGRALPRRGRWLPAALAAGAYLLVVGPRPAILRASAMALLAALALLRERPPQSWRALTVAAAALVAAEPGLIAELGFRLTFAATAGIVLSGPLLASRWTALPPALSRPLAASVGAQLATLPWSVAAFHLATPLAPVLNLAAVPWTALALAVCLGWSVLAAVWPAAAAWSRQLPELAALPFTWASLPPADRVAVLPVDAGAGEGALAAAALWVVLARPSRVRLALVGVLMLALLLAPSRRAPGPELVVLDVGQGEALLLRDGRSAALLDGGGWARGDLGGRVLLPALARLGVRRLHALVLSHPDLDHCGGLVDIASYLPVEEVWSAPGGSGVRCARELVGLPGTRLRPLWRGRSARLGRWRLRALHPAAGDRGAGNDRSLVLMAEIAGRRVLLTGDIEARSERRLLRRPADLACDVLKVAHHGSGSSSVPAFLRAAAPRLAVISAGPGNPYGHPSPAVLQRLARSGIPVLRTDRSGAIRLLFESGGPMRIQLPGRPR